MFGNDQKLVYFDEYCPKCLYYPKSGDEDPCYECLNNPTNTWSHEPIKFEEKDGKKI